MKANEAPEKIYLDDSMATDTAGESWVDALWFDTKVSDDSIEYTRTDAFIEKATAWLDENLLNYWSQAYTDNCNFIEDFKKYMKEK